MATREQLVLRNGGGELSPQTKWPGREGDYSPPFSAEIKNMRSYTSTPYSLMSWCSITHRKISSI